MHPIWTLLRCVIAAALVLFLASWVAPALAQPRALTLEPGERIALDGRLDEPAWQRAPLHDRFVQFLPLDRQPPPAGYRTTVQVLAERDALVLGIRAFDPAPHEIRAPLTRRDQVKRDQDFVAVLLDAVGDRRAAQFVRVNAAGVLTDGMYIAAGDSEDYAPDFDVDAAVQRLPDGYSVELRLPFIALRYPHDGGAPWRLMVARSVPRASSTLLLSAPLTKDGMSFIAEAQVIEGLEAVAERARAQSLLWFRPELTLRGTRERAAGQPTRRDEEVSLGAEFKWRPRADWVVDATLNPDFSQVELDAPQLAGNTRFALSVPEKRPFFLESTDVIDQPLAGFYSRSVTDPRYGLRATWRAPKADATALTLRDEGGGLVLRPGPFGTALYAQDGRSQATLLRARRHEGDVTAGVLLSDRDYAERGRNSVAGVDLYWSPNAQDQLRARVLGSRNSATFDAQGAAEAGPVERGHWIELRWNRRNNDWIVNLDLDDLSPRFRNDNGFVEQTGVRRIEAEVVRRWGEARALGYDAHEFETYVWTEQVVTRRDATAGIDGGRMVARRWHPGIWFAGPLNSEGWAQVKLDAERVRPDGRLHATRGAAAQFGFNPASWIPRATVELNVGDMVDVEADRVGRGIDGFVEVILRGSLAGFGVESEQKLQHAQIDRNGRRALTDSAARWLGVLHLSARDSLRAVWQASRYRRGADAALSITALSEDQCTLSLVFQHRVGLGRNLSVGATHSRTEPGRERKDEVFVKAALAL
ncbi:MAG TPA: DUF5916 domain-containing protein [Burkholderiaceae bacterium]|nr:DUF5916 domain-containing protein [Burkholderiaceae bacterium]